MPGALIAIVSGSSAPDLVDQLRDWFIDEWGEQDAFNRLIDGRAPAPLLAIDDGELIGGLAFSRFYKHQSEEMGLWINALFVAPEQRRQGIASRLIQSAAAEATAAGYDALFALTDLPALYLKQNWVAVGESENGTVVSIALPQ